MNYYFVKFHSCLPTFLFFFVMDEQQTFSKICRKGLPVSWQTARPRSASFERLIWVLPDRLTEMGLKTHLRAEAKSWGSINGTYSRSSKRPKIVLQCGCNVSMWKWHEQEIWCYRELVTQGCKAVFLKLFYSIAPFSPSTRCFRPQAW